MSDRWDRLTAATEGLAVLPLKSLDELVAALAPETLWWGFYTMPSEARLLRTSGDRWAEITRRPALQELRIFGPQRDLHWLGGRGVALESVPAAELGWLQRDRRSRLWGEALEGTDAWYEERIPDPLRYEGLTPGPENPYAFLIYREYVQAGAVQYVRYLGVEGGA